MATRRQQIRVGIFTVFSTALLIIGLALVSGFKHEKRTPYYVEFDESVLGLSEGSMVEYLGVPVGVVDSIYVSGTNLAHVNLLVTSSKVELYQGVQAKLVIYSIATGTMAISLSGGDGQNILEPGSEIPTVKSRIEAVGTKIESIIEDLSDMADILRKGMEGIEEGKVGDIVHEAYGLITDARDFLAHTDRAIEDVSSSVKASLDNVNTFTNETEALAKDLRALATDVRAKVNEADVAGISSGVNNILEEVGALTERLNEVADSLDLAAKTATRKADNVEYKLGVTLRELSDSLESVRDLANDLQDDPASLLRGKSTKKEK